MNTTTRRTLLRSFWISLITVIALFAAVWFGGRAWMAASVMPYEGRTGLKGLSAEVEILFDGRGIPRIYAATDADAVRALGWLHAGERLFQMELIRRLAAGELAELVGPAALELDILHRGFGFARRVREDAPVLDADTALLLNAYVAGINARIETAERLPPEFLLLRHQPQAWALEDILSIAYYQSFYPLTLVQQIRESFQAISETFGPEAADWLHRLSDLSLPTVPLARMTEASNTWVVSPQRSASGSALHASDPHLEFDSAPGLWYAAGLHSRESLDVIGITAPGLPFVAMGHNGRIAWAFTVAPVDLFELYRLERNPDRPDQVRGPSGWMALTEREETIRVRDREQALVQSYQYTALGKVVESSDESVLVLRWAGFDLPIEPLIPAGLAISRAGDFQAFRAAAADMGALSVNWSYSDRDGNIGYQQSTPVPMRTHQRFHRVLDGAVPEHDWAGFHAPEQRPYALNPEQGWLANANNLAAGSDWAYALPGFYYQDRIRRATALLESQERYTQADMTRFQLDQVSDRALRWKDWLAETAEASGRELIAADLRRWDGNMDLRSDVAGLFARWWGYLPKALFQSDDPDRPDWQALRPVIDSWLSDSTFPELATRPRDEAAQLALDDALRAGARPLGMIQTLHVRHPLAQAGLLDRWLGLSRGPFAFGGDSASLNASFAQFDTESATWRARAGASMRYTLDWADPEAFTLNLSLGQSGNPLSPHFDSFLSEFLRGSPWVVPWDPATVRRDAASRLVLAPAN